MFFIATDYDSEREHACEWLKALEEGNAAVNLYFSIRGQSVLPTVDVKCSYNSIISVCVFVL